MIFLRYLKCGILGLIISCFSLTGFAQSNIGDLYPDWMEGYLDIHHINTGRGECSFYILPDGTTMLVDAGATSRPKPRVADPKPDDSRTPGDWISRYITRMMHNLPDIKLNYILLTHFHDDHMGSITGVTNHGKGDYLLSGITEVGEKIPFEKIVDRGWPDYNWPVSMENDNNMQNYIKFIRWNKENRNVVVEKFRVGVNNQFILVNHPEKYPNFEIRNIASNGHVWTGVADNTRNHFPPLESISKEDTPSENQCSNAIRISYGKFDYFNGGDITNMNRPRHWKDIETPVGLVTGPVDVCVANHHANYDVMGEDFLSAVRPKVIVLLTWAPSQPDNSALNRMRSKRIYPGERDIFATNVMEETKVVIGAPLAQLKSQQGHIAIRVEPTGEEYTIYILDDSTESYKIKAIFGPYECH